MSKTSNFFKTKKNWSKYKDKLLETYLPPYFQKVLRTNKEIVYIDGFAGKGKFDDGQKGSPLIVSEIINKAKQHTKGNNYNIKANFIEYKYADELKKNLNSNCNVYKADYREKVREILLNSKNSNVFLYVDPFGIKYLDFNIFKLLNANEYNSVELLLNLNAFGYIREGCRLLGVDVHNEEDTLDEDNDDDKFKNSIENMNLIANGNYWQKIIEKYKNREINMREAEDIFVDEYTNQLKMIFKYSCSIPIRTNEAYIPKYRMIYCTNHADGILIMGDVMCKCNKQMKDENTGYQISLFDFLNPQACDEYVLSVLDGNYIDIKKFCLKLYNQNGIQYPHTDIQNSLKELEKRNIIDVKRTPGYTKNGKIVTALTIMRKDYIIELRKK